MNIDQLFFYYFDNASNLVVLGNVCEVQNGFGPKIRSKTSF